MSTCQGKIWTGACVNFNYNGGFTKWTQVSELYGVLSSELSAFLARYGKAPSRKMRINVRNEVHDDRVPLGTDGDNTALTDLIVAVAKLLSSSELDALRNRLKALSRR